MTNNASLVNCASITLDGVTLMSDKQTTTVVPAAPSWMKRPNCPGMWVCVGDDTNTIMRGKATVLTLSQLDIDRGAPFATQSVYGPIPPSGLDK